MTTVVNKVNKPVIAGEKVVFEWENKEVKLNNTTLDLALNNVAGNSSYLEENKYKTKETKCQMTKHE